MICTDCISKMTGSVRNIECKTSIPLRWSTGPRKVLAARGIKQRMMSKALKGRMLNPYFGGLPSYEQRLTFTRKKQAVLRTTRTSVSFLFDFTNLHG